MKFAIILLCAIILIGPASYIYHSHNTEGVLENPTDVLEMSEPSPPLAQQIPLAPESNVKYWDEDPIPYYFSENYPCPPSIKARVLKVFTILKKETDGAVSFNEWDKQNAIEVRCLKEKVSEESAGYGGIEYYVGEPEIFSGTVKLNKRDSGFVWCPSYPTIEMHEVLHAMGFHHMPNPKSIMNPSPKKCQELDKVTRECLFHLYADDKNYSCKDVKFIGE